MFGAYIEEEEEEEEENPPSPYEKRMIKVFFL